ncbi:fused response regulator/phosphatase [Thermomonospora amylolytica]|uniref:fused response regulator/phosphatase n=1 Tax=Thermomonospora amylolytica TaxID=1411117 RepID=UPI000E6C6B83|nr:fused response regulator/phosphatase [Thermomonospora amylolytica]
MSSLPPAPLTTLVVDDAATKRYIIGSWLRRAGHTVIEAASAAEAWERLADHEPDLVVLDVRLPDASGFEVCEQIKSDPATGSLPVIHISGSAVEVADRAHGLRGGADAYLTDPIDPDEFLATVQAVLRYYQARRTAERLAERLAALTRASLAINAADTFDRLTAAAARGAAEVFGVRSVAMILPLDGRLRRIVCLPPTLETWPRSVRPDILERIGRFVALGQGTGTAVAIVPGERWREVLPDAAIAGDVSMVMSRTKVGRPPVCLAVEAHGVLDEDEFNMLRQLGQTVAVAVEALRSYAEERSISETLQRSLLPTALPHVPGWTFALRYEPASRQAEVGGDFYEVLPIGDRLLVAIGDVQGHSLHAATVMAELRHALRAFAVEGHDAVRILTGLNRVLRRYHEDQTATICLLTLGPADGAVQVASAGHMAPLFAVGGRARFGAGGGLLLGFPAEDISVEEVRVPPGGLVLLHTDGLVEDRGVPISDNLERLRVLAADADPDLEAFSDRVLAAFGRREDDVAMIVLRRDA